MVRGLVELLKVLRVDDAGRVSVRRLGAMFADFDQSPAELRATSLNANISVSQAEAELLLEHGARGALPPRAKPEAG